MAILRTNFNGENYVGLFGFATDSYALLTNRLTKQKYERLSNALGVPVEPTLVSSMSLVGIMAAGNSNGLLLPYITKEREYEALKKFGVGVVEERFTALGNLVVCNDKGAIISKLFSDKTRGVVEDILGVEVHQMRIAKCDEVGALCEATNNGFVATPDATDDEIEEIAGVLKVEGGKASANFGSKVVGVCMIANSNGYVVGEETTGVEIQYINEALNII